ncbi:arylsulfatase [Luteolibacter soli]|uniref:Arylsulfatase n=1 Tax=Luteolibacter soli TaxID=3135280 RepID=A0ABU9AVL0_9BACT
MKSLFAVTLVLAAAGAIGSVSAASKPNILLVLLDDLGYSDLGCYGGEIPTPNIDALAKGGLRFTHMANSARCCPSRASLLTGLHPAQAGIPNFSGQLSQDTATLPEVLKGAGYQTYMVGKWHVGNSPEASPVARGFDEFYGFTNGHSAGQWDPRNYKRLPADHEQLKYEPGKFYATDVFGDYAQEFIKQAGKKKEQPWFLYLAYSAAHFPIQAPEKSAAPFYETYRRGWDALREERFKKMKEIGLINSDGWKLSPLSIVPVAPPARANGYPGKPNPDWKSLDAPRREDLAHRMALYAAMVKHVDDGMGRIVKQLKENGSYENTLILLLSDNGACYEWGPFGFDGESGAGKNVLHEGKELEKMGGPGTHMSYGSGWANLGNTPFRLYKHFTHEGGIITPFIVHWPQGIKDSNRWVRDPAHVMDLMPTLAEVGGATYPKMRDGHQVQPMEGISLTPTFRSTAALPERALCFQHEGAYAIRKGQWKLVKGKRFPEEAKWELYDILADPCEMNDLAAKKPELVASLAKEWQAWADRVGALAAPKAKAAAAGKGKKKGGKEEDDGVDDG